MVRRPRSEVHPSFKRMRAVVAALLCASAGAFVAPAQTRSSLIVRQGTLDGMVGASEEFGGVAWDPLGLSKISELTKGSEHDSNFPDVKFMREAEIKHGESRAARLASFREREHASPRLKPPYPPRSLARL